MQIERLLAIRGLVREGKGERKAGGAMIRRASFLGVKLRWAGKSIEQGDGNERGRKIGQRLLSSENIPH